MRYPHVTTPATNPALWELVSSSNPSDSALTANLTADHEVYPPHAQS